MTVLLAGSEPIEMVSQERAGWRFRWRAGLLTNETTANNSLGAPSEGGVRELARLQSTIDGRQFAERPRHANLLARGCRVQPDSPRQPVRTRHGPLRRPSTFSIELADAFEQSLRGRIQVHRQIRYLLTHARFGQRGLPGLNSLEEDTMNLTETPIKLPDDFCIEHYANDPMKAPESKLITEILIPTG
jgi:hypothetical protein